jgi:hypothetical protein
MSTLETQYKNYLKENPESTFTFEEWSDWKFSNMEIPPPHNGLRPIDEYACSLGGGDDIVSHLFNSKDWDATLMDGLENEPPYVSDDYSPYCSVCGGCGEEGCCSPLTCKQSDRGDYCSTYLDDLQFGYRMYRDLMRLLKDDEKYKQHVDELFNKNYDLIYRKDEKPASNN